MKDKLRRILKDRTTRDILKFFYQNQASIDSVGGISTWVRDDRKKVQSALDELVKLRVLEEDSSGAAKGYSYTRDEKIVKIIEGLARDAEF